ncbi:hypothetical protein GJAV_G00142810 [Gymnothorax javanicus]|nr:hypothetical protein GJAV_G00142810 [Gymnothorax javanicus]
MALENGTNGLNRNIYWTEPSPLSQETEQVEQYGVRPPSHEKGAKHPKRPPIVKIIVVLVILGGGGALAWYFIEYRVWHEEPRVMKHFSAAITILNRNYSSQLASGSSLEFKAEARAVEDMVKELLTSSDLSRYYNSTAVFAFGDGSLIVYLWFILSVPESHDNMVTVDFVGRRLTSHLKALSEEDIASFQGYDIHLPTVFISEIDAKVIERLKASFGCHRYYEVTSGSAVALKGPNTQRQSCMWLLKGPQGSQLVLRLEWLLPYCRDRLAVYDSVTPTDSRLITSLYGCSMHERVVSLVSSGQWMIAVWKQGRYSFRDPFALSVQARPPRDCSFTFNLRPVAGVQGSFRTPFYPSYYPPDTNCSWEFNVPSLKYGLTLEFEGYELRRPYYQEPCTQGQWVIQNRRLCGTRNLQPYAERIYLLSKSTTVTMTSEVSLTGPGLQVQYSLFSKSDPCPGRFLCTLNGQCVTACDGIRDCPNGLDERNCVCVAQYECPEDSRCIDYFEVCDDHPDCRRGKDEADCTNGVECTEMTYVCADGTCIKKPNPQCDLITDCPDASDESQCNCGLRHFSSRVVGGLDASEGEWPWQVSLQAFGDHICGGTLISSQWVVSAAHCFHDDRLYAPRLWTAYLGKLWQNGTSETEEAIRVSEILLHQYYDHESHDYDLALLRLEKPVSARTLAQPACLPARTHLLEPGLLCWVTGWGALKEGGHGSKILQKLAVPLLSEDVCTQSYGSLISPRMLCAGYYEGKRDSCQGDSGGPLVCQEASGRWFLAGVVSWGFGCGRPYYYGVYTRVTKLTDWIQERISP